MTAGAPLFSLRDAALQVGERTLFAGTSWVVRRGEHWAIVGPTGSGKSLLASALCGRVPVVGGGIRYHFPAGWERPWFEEGSVVRVGSDELRLLVDAQIGFHQGRWHATESGAGQTVGELLGRRSVEAMNPYQVLGINLTAVMTFLLICSSVTMVKALEWLGKGDRAQAIKFLLFTALGGTIFVSLQAYEWTHLIHRGLQILGRFVYPVYHDPLALYLSRPRHLDLSVPGAIEPHSPVFHPFGDGPAEIGFSCIGERRVWPLIESQRGRITLHTGVHGLPVI